MKPLLSIYAIFNAFFGILLFFVPATIVSWYGPSNIDAVGTAAFRYAGALSIGLAVLSWYARQAEAGRARNAIVLAFTVINLLGMINSYIAASSGAFNNLAWSELAFYAIFTIAFVVAGRSSMTKVRTQQA